MSRITILVALLLLAAAPASAQRVRSFAYGAGAAGPGALGLQITASVEEREEGSRLGRRLDLIVHDGEEREGYALASLVYRRGGGEHVPYGLAGLGFYTGGEGVPFAASAGVGVESTGLSAAPVFLEARLLYGASVYYDRDSSFGIGDHVLSPALTLGVRLPPKRRS